MRTYVHRARSVTPRRWLTLRVLTRAGPDLGIVYAVANTDTRKLGFDLRIFDGRGEERRLAVGERAFLDEREDRGRHLRVTVPLNELPGPVRALVGTAGPVAASDVGMLEILESPLLDRLDVSSVDLELTNADHRESKRAGALLASILGNAAQDWAQLLESPRQTWASAGTVAVPGELTTVLYEALDFDFIENDEFLVRRDLRVAYGPTVALTVFSSPDPSEPTFNLGLGSRTKRELSTPGLLTGSSGPDRAAIALEDVLNHLDWTTRHLDGRFERWETEAFHLATSLAPLSDRLAAHSDLQARLAGLVRTANAARASERTFSRRLSARVATSSPHFDQSFRSDGLGRLKGIAETITEHRASVRAGFEMLNSIGASLQAELSQQAQDDDRVFQQRIGIFAAALIIPSLFVGAFGANDLHLPSPQAAGWLLLVGGTVLIATLLPVILAQFTATEVLGRSRRWLLGAAMVATLMLVSGCITAASGT